MALEEAPHEFSETTGVDDDLAHFDDFSASEFFPAWADGAGFADAAYEHLYFREREPHFAGKPDQ